MIEREEGEVVAMCDASLTIARGEVAAQLGPSGAGKTTLLTVVELVTPPTEGRLSIAGQPVLDGPCSLINLRTFRRQRLGFVFQLSNLIPFSPASRCQRPTSRFERNET